MGGLSIAETAQFAGLAGKEDDLNEFSTLLQLDTRSPAGALKTTLYVYNPMVINYTPKIAIRQAWTMCKTATTETTAKKKEEKNADSDSDDETNDPSLRRAALDEFRKRFHYSIPMHHQPSTFCCHPNPMVRVQNVGQNVCAILEEPRKKRPRKNLV